MHRVMSSSDNIAKQHGRIAAYPSPSAAPPEGYSDVNLTTCLQSMRTAALPAQKGASSNVDTAAIATIASESELIDGFTVSPNSATAALETHDEDVAPDSSEESNETSRIDREVRRLHVLKSYLGLLDADHGNKFERLTALASRIFRTPMAMVTIADLNKQYCISSRGLDFTSGNKSPFCSQAVLADCDLMVVNDASKDNRFADDPQVKGYPNVRFYAGAPLICPEGHRLGTLCVMDSSPRMAPVTLEEKQSLMELAAMAMENLVELRKKKQYALKDPSQQIACTAHDLLTPLTGIVLSLSLLREDEGLQGKLTEQQRDMIETAANCSTVMNSICHKTMEFFREQGRPKDSTKPSGSQRQADSAGRMAPSTVKTSVLVKNLNMVLEPFPKQVPIIITVEDDVPSDFVSDDMKIFRSASNFLTNACAKTESGSITLRIFKRSNPENGEDELVFECEDTGSGVDIAKYGYLFKPVPDEQDPLSLPAGSRTVLTDMPSGALREGVQNSGLGLFSVATQIRSLGGKYGFRPRERQGSSSSDEEENGSIFWFSVPLVLPSSLDAEQVLHRDTTSTSGISLRAPATLRRCNTSFSDSSGRRRSGLIRVGSSTEFSTTRSDESLSRLSGEDALEAFAATPSSMRNKRFRLSESPARMPQALVIEDSLVVRKNLARVLTKLGFEVSQAVNGMEGLMELKASLFDVVLCDFLMPVMDGLDCIQQYRQWEKANRPFFKQYIIGISAHASDRDVQQGFKIGMNAFRSKPLTFKDVEQLKQGKDFQRKKGELDKLGHEVEVLKRRKLEPDSELEASAVPNQKVCLVVEGLPVISKLAEMASSSIGWQVVSVIDSDSALGLLKMRNWDAVLVDDDLGCNRCISIFREWEKKQRVNRQKNVILVSAKYVPSKAAGTSFQAPTGFDGALAKPIELSSLQSFFKEATTNWEIVTR